jgi:hypothetical protein
MTDEIEHSGVVALGDGVTDDMVAAALDAFELTGHFATADAIRAALTAALARPAQEPVCTVSVIGAGGHRWLTPHPLNALDALPVGTPLYASPQPVINPTHSQGAGTPGLLTDAAPVAEIIAKLREDMTASPVDGVTVIDRGQLEVFSAALTPPPQDRKRVKLPPIGDELYEHYPAMSAQTHADLVRDYAREAVRAALKSEDSADE